MQLWLAIIPYIRRINNLRDCLHSAHFVKILGCLRAFDICSAGLFPSFALGDDLVLENLALRQQLLALHSKRPRPRLGALDKLFWVLLRGLASALTILQDGSSQADQRARSIGVKITNVNRETISVTVEMSSLGTHVECEIPLDATVESIIIDINSSLHLPRIQVDGRPFQWDLRSKFLGTILDSRKTIRENNVPDKN